LRIILKLIRVKEQWVVDALVQAVAALDRLDKNGETDLILKRNENPEVLN